LRDPSSGQHLGLLVLGLNPRFPFDSTTAGYLDEVGLHVATALSLARGREPVDQPAAHAEALDRAKTIFFSNVSHEFRTPLALMLGPVEQLLARNGTSLRPDEREQLGIARRSGLRLLKLADALVDLARIEAGHEPLHTERLDLSAITIELANLFRPLIERAGLQFEVECPPLSKPVVANGEMWEKIVLNLLSNALKFTFEGHIRIELREEAQGVVLIVSDTGIGIPKEEIDHVFRRFHRLPNARARSQEGVGLGLAVVQELARVHGGSVSVSSAESRGSTFAVRLPLGSVQPDLAERPAAPRESKNTRLAATPYIEEAQQLLPQPPAAPPDREPDAAVTETAGEARILVVDDNPDIRLFVSRLLGKQFEVETANDGRQALASIRRKRPDLVLSDVMMPEMNGLELLRALKSEPDTKSIPVILLSGRAGEDSRVEGLESGADDYLTKPFGPRELLARIAVHLGAARSAAKREQELKAETQAAQASLAQVLANISDGIIQVNREGLCTFVNARAGEIVGKTPEELMGKPFIQMLAPELQASLVPKLQQATRAELVAFEHHCPALQRSFEGRIHATDNGALLFLADMTERRRAEEALRESEQRWRLALETSQMGYWIWSLHAGDVYWSPGCASMMGLSPDPLNGPWSSFLERIHYLDRPQVIREFELAVREQRDAQAEFRINLSDGKNRWISCRGRLLSRSENSPPDRLIGVVRDISEQKQAEEVLRNVNATLEQRVADRSAEANRRAEELRLLAIELTQAEQLERRRLAMAIHDRLRQLMAAASLNLAPVLRRIPDAETRHALQSIDDLVRKAIAAAESLTDELSPPVLHEAGLGPALSWLASRMKEQHGLEVEIDLDDQAEPENDAMREFLFSAARELLVNVVKHARVDQARLSAKIAGSDRLQITVCDGGVGFDADRIDGERRPVGTVFGLAGLRQRLALLSGEMEIDSFPNFGTTVTLTAPRRKPAQLEEFDPDAIVTASEGRDCLDRKIRILLADDHKIMREGLAGLILEQPDMEIVSEASNGLLALELARQIRPDVIIMDVNMPRMDGPEATRRIRKELPEVRVIALSMHEEQSIANRMHDAGASAFFTKGGPSEALIDAIRDTCRERV
jgi:PAS domain S-box-containing protein